MDDANEQWKKDRDAEILARLQRWSAARSADLPCDPVDDLYAQGAVSREVNRRIDSRNA